MLINEKRSLLHWLSSSIFTPVKYENIRLLLQQHIFEVFNKTSILYSIFQHAGLLQGRHVAAKLKLVWISAVFSKLGTGNGYSVYLVEPNPLCNLVRSNQVKALNTTSILKKQDFICPTVVLKVSDWRSSIYFRFYKQRSQYIMLDVKPPDKSHRNNLSEF